MIPDALLDSFKSTLYAGGYNLLLGSGVSLDSKNGRGQFLRSAEGLRKHLCDLKGARDGTSLQRIATVLSEEESRVELVASYSNCKPGPSVSALPNYIWSRIFTFNIDDVVECLYESDTARKQALVPLNYDSQFEPDSERGELHLIHLHGSVRKASSGFVFSHSEYARVMTTMNPWMHLLAQILPSDSFIIAGTTLNEIDLEYYLSHRSSATPRRGRGPGLLIEPNPDPLTVKDCERYGLTLVKATFGEFLSWLVKTFPRPPTLLELAVPSKKNIFSSPMSPARTLRFFSDFRIIEARETARNGQLSPFLYGREPEDSDLDQHLDISRKTAEPLIEIVARLIGDTAPQQAGVVVSFGLAGDGKTTLIKRMTHDLSRAGVTVLSLNATPNIDAANALACFEHIAGKVVLLVDDFADYVDAIRDIVADKRSRNLVVIGAERKYRKDFVDLVLADIKWNYVSSPAFSHIEYKQLIESYRIHGLLADSEAIRAPDDYARRLLDDTVAVAVCRILNDFRPLRAIADSLWDATSDEFRMPYVCSAIARHCYVTGLSYSLLQAITGTKVSIKKMMTGSFPLGIVENPENPAYVVPLSSAMAESIVDKLVASDSAYLLEAFRRIATRLALYVNRLAIIRRTPEARLAGRLFDADRVVKPLLGVHAAAFYDASQRSWEWNSRYWEQRALLSADSDIEMAIRYARHGVAIENHPYPLTTLGKLLLRRMESTENPQGAFDEAFATLNGAIRMEGAKTRITIHPFSTLIGGAIRFLNIGGRLSAAQYEELQLRINEANRFFARDQRIQTDIARLRAELARLGAGV